MRPDSCVVYTPGKDSFSVNTWGYNRVTFLGSNARCSLPPGQSEKSFAMSNPKKEKGGVTIYAVSGNRITDKGHNMGSFVFVLAVEWNEHESTFVATEANPWIPFADRLLQVHKDGVSVVTEKATYTSSSSVAKEHGFKFVPDGNLICQFAAKNKGVDIKMIEKAVQKIEKEKSEIERLKAKIKELDANHDDALNQLLEADEKIKRLRRDVEKWSDAARALKTATDGSPIWIKKRVRDSLSSFPFPNTATE